MDLQTEHIAGKVSFIALTILINADKMLKFATKYKIKLTLMEKSIVFGTR